MEEVTLAETMKTAGYRTALFGKWHLGSHRDYGPTRQPDKVKQLFELYDHWQKDVFSR